jgi:hypothetical protein
MPLPELMKREAGIRPKAQPTMVLTKLQSVCNTAQTLNPGKPWNHLGKIYQYHPN